MQLGHHRGMTLLEAAVLIAVIGLIIAIILPAFTGVIGNDRQLTSDLVKAKQIFDGLKAHAIDHNGRFPHSRADGGALRNANDAFRSLIPNYINTKRIFYSRNSPWTPNPNYPDFSKETIIPGITPAAGENHWAYVPNLTLESNPLLPIVATGFAKGTPGTYSTDAFPKPVTPYFQKVTYGDVPASPPPTPKELKVIVVCRDGSGRVTPVSLENFRVYRKLHFFRKIDLFKPAPGWLRPDQVPLNPEG